ncbi:MAG: hypothetical protein INH43_08170 [Acidobacteriaceae bacterium]|jgi:hypothetical protein|nr:hypothetical protein [Acidobacteriaceae bacterium]
MAKAPTKGKPLKPGLEPSVLTFTNHDGADAFTPLNFRVPAKFHREFKIYAVQNGMSMVELLQQSFQLMKSQRKR